MDKLIVNYIVNDWRHQELYVTAVPNSLVIFDLRGIVKNITEKTHIANGNLLTFRYFLNNLDYIKTMSICRLNKIVFNISNEEIFSDIRNKILLKLREIKHLCNGSSFQDNVKHLTIFCTEIFHQSCLTDPFFEKDHIVWKYCFVLSENKLKLKTKTLVKDDNLNSQNIIYGKKLSKYLFPEEFSLDYFEDEQMIRDIIL